MKIFQKHILLFIFLLALLLRLVTLGLTYKGPDIEYWENVKIAINMMEGRGYSIDYSVRNDAYNNKFMQNQEIKMPRSEGFRPTAFKPPVYTLLVYFIFQAFGVKNFLALFLFQAILSSLTCIFIFLALRAYSKRIAVFAALGIAIYPSFIFHAVTSPENTTLVSLLIAIFFYYLVKLYDHCSPAKWLVIGIVSATLALTEVISILFMFLSILYFLFVSDISGSQKLKGAAIFVTSFAILTSPWLIRNYLVFNHPFLFKSSAGHIMLVGLYNAKGDILIEDKTLQALEVKGRGKTEVHEDKAIQKEVFKSIYKNAGTYFKEIVPANFVFYWWEDKKYIGNDSLQYDFGRKIPYIFLLLFSLPSLFWYLKAMIIRPVTIDVKSLVNNASIILIFSFTLVYTIFGATRLRYHFPVELLLFVHMAQTLGYLYQHLMNLIFKQHKTMLA